MERSKIGLVTAKIEGTYGTDSTPSTAANTISVIRDSAVIEYDADAIERLILDGGLSRVPGDNSLPRAKIKFKTELRGNRIDGTAADISSGSSANAVEIDCLLQACDMAATYTAQSGGGRNGNVIYAPSIFSTIGPSVTFYLYTHLRLHKIVGCKGNWKIVAENGKYPVIEWEFMGLYVAPADNSFPASATFLNTKPQLFVNSSVTWGAYAAIFTKLNLDLGNKVEMRGDATSTVGVNSFIITDRVTKGDFDPESVAEATNPFWADWKAGNLKTLTVPFGQTGSSFTGNQVQLTLTSALPRKQPYAVRNNARIHNVAFDVVRASLSATLNSDVALQFS